MPHEQKTRQQRIAEAIHDVECGCDNFQYDEDSYYDPIAADVVVALDKREKEVHGG